MYTFDEIYPEIETILLRECRKRIHRYQIKTYLKKKIQKRYQKVTGREPVRHAKYPPHWEMNHFNPFYCRSNVLRIAHGLTHSLASLSYESSPSIRKFIKKPGSKKERMIDIFSIPDSTVAFWLWENIHLRETAVLGQSAYAYRKDRSRKDAVRIVIEMLFSTPRLFVIEADFSKFFDSISHKALISIIGRSNLTLDEVELTAIKAILNHRYVLTKSDGSTETGYRNLGIPQGNSVSLLLANVACLEFDQAIRDSGCSLFRFSDDMLVICKTYKHADDAWVKMHQEGANIGVSFNYYKSKGISLWSQFPNDKDIRRAESINFLGYEINLDGRVRIRESSMNRLKSRCLEIIYRNLLKYVKKGIQITQRRIGNEGTDFDLMICLNDLRKAIHGSYNRTAEQELMEAKGEAELTNIYGWLQYFPLVTDYSQMLDFDNWLRRSVYTAYNLRQKVLANNRRFRRFVELNFDDLTGGTWYKREFDETPPASFPSMTAAYRKLKRFYIVKGHAALPDRADYS